MKCGGKKWQNGNRENICAELCAHENPFEERSQGWVELVGSNPSFHILILSSLYPEVLNMLLYYEINLLVD